MFVGRGRKRKEKGEGGIRQIPTRGVHQFAKLVSPLATPLVTY